MSIDDLSPGEQRMREYVDQRTAVAKRRYEHMLALQLQVAGEQPDNREGQWDPDAFDSPLLGPGGYFEPANTRWISFHGTGGYTAKILEDEITEWKRAVEKDGKKFLAADFFGQGRACIELGADAVVSTSLLPNPHKLSQKIHEVPGDGLSEVVSEQAFEKIEELKAHGFALRLAFFRPVSGLIGAHTNLYVFRRLYENLRRLYDVMDEGGLIFCSSIGLGIDTVAMQGLLETTGFSSLLLRPVNAGGFCIRKQTSICPRLPSETEIARSSPIHLKLLMALDAEEKKLPPPKRRRRIGID